MVVESKQESRHSSNVSEFVLASSENHALQSDI